MPIKLLLGKDKIKHYLRELRGFVWEKYSFIGLLIYE